MERVDELKSTLRLLRSDYKALRDDYEVIKQNVKDNVDSKKALRIKIATLNKEYQTLKPKK